MTKLDVSGFMENLGHVQGLFFHVSDPGDMECLPRPAFCLRGLRCLVKPILVICVGFVGPAEGHGEGEVSVPGDWGLGAADPPVRLRPHSRPRRCAAARRRPPRRPRTPRRRRSPSASHCGCAARRWSSGWRRPPQHRGTDGDGARPWRDSCRFGWLCHSPVCEAPVMRATADSVRAQCMVSTRCRNHCTHWWDSI